jgi:predicted molibdopterin-dependent oxidoreductase YjgC
MEAAARGLGSLRSEGGSVGVLGSGRSTNEDNFLAVTLARSALGMGHIDSVLGGYWAALLGGMSGGVAADHRGSLARLERADVVLVVEGDIGTSHPRIASAVIRAIRRGCLLITAGVTPSRLGELAAVQVQLPAAAPVDGLEAMRCAVGGMPAGEAAIDDAARILGSGGSVAVVVAPFARDSEILRAAGGVVAELGRLLTTIHGIPPLLLPLPIRANTRGAYEAGVAPDRLPGQRLLWDRSARARLEGVWGGAPCWDAGFAAETMVDSVDGLVVVVDDVVSLHARPSRARESLGSMELVVVLDSFLTPTAAAADVVLPVAAYGETVGTFTNFEGRTQEVQRPVAPTPEVRPAWEVLAELGGALGAGFRPKRLDEVRAALAEAIGPTHVDVAPSPDAAGVRSESPGAKPANGGPYLLREEGVHEWADDPLVDYAPVLRRAAACRRSASPRGLVLMSPEDAAAVGVTDGGAVRLVSDGIEVESQLRIRNGQQPGLVSVPFMFRETMTELLGRGGQVEVEVSNV